MVICQGRGCNHKRQAMRLDLQHKPYEALRVQSGGKCWSSSYIENNFKRVKQRCNVSKQRAGCAWDRMDEWRCRQKQTVERRCNQRQCVDVPRVQLQL